jgi:hypothetical protein
MMAAFGECGCRYLVRGSLRQCGRAQRAGSPYCAEHHRLCYLPRGSAAERLRLAEDAADLKRIEREENAKAAAVAYR